ncbi:hypothetical protein vBCbaSRXM_22 [Citromicrobium phage vB_CbaS-RXM]|nr:hypothetical protein vBCbaSRXM_22 [Citromicrobium phage vB_CbaS-RXM]
MSHTIGSKKPEGFKVEVFDYDGRTVHSAFYPDRDEAQKVAEHWERLVTLGLADGSPRPDLDEILSDDELLRELGE